MKKILVLGGCGFIGKNLVEEFSGDRRYSVLVFDRPEVVRKTVKVAGVKYYGGEFSSREQLERIFRNNKIHTVIHLVSTTIPADSDGFGMVFDIESNLVPTVRLLCLMQKFKAKKIVFASSGGTVYGPASARITRTGIPEAAPTNPICSHGTVKLSIEKYIQLSAYLHQLKYLVLRISNPYGEYHSSRVQGLVNVALRSAYERRAVTIWGDGKVVRDYIYVKDCVGVIKKLVDKEVAGEVVNIGSGTGHSINAVLSAVRGRAGSFKVRRKPARRFDVPRVVLDISRLRSLTRFRPTSLREGIRKTYDWLKRNE